MTIGAGTFCGGDNKAAVHTSTGLCAAERCAAPNTLWRTNLVCSIAIFTLQPAQTFGKGMGNVGGFGKFLNVLPDTFPQLKGFDILSEIIEPAQQGKRVPKRAERRFPQAGGDSHPILFPHLNTHPIGYFLKRNGGRGLSACARKTVGGNLDDHLIAAPDFLRTKVAPVKTGNQLMRDFVWG